MAFAVADIRFIFGKGDVGPAVGEGVVAQFQPRIDPLLQDVEARTVEVTFLLQLARIDEADGGHITPAKRVDDAFVHGSPSALCAVRTRQVVDGDHYAEVLRTQR